MYISKERRKNEREREREFNRMTNAFLHGEKRRETIIMYTKVYIYTEDE